jgi:hypothetical protein
MTGSVRRRNSSSRALLALAGVALLALLAFAALLLGGAFGERAETSRPEVHGATITAVGERNHATDVHAIHQQPSTRARSAAFAVLALATVIAAWAFQRLRFARAGRPRTLRIVGLPPGRGPPALRIV